MSRILNRLGYELVRYEGGTQLLIVDHNLSSITVSWRSGIMIKRKGKSIVVNEIGEVSTKYPESQDHRKYITIKNK